MARWFGVVGYGSVKEVTPGDYQDVITKREYSGDVLRNSTRWSTAPASTNDNFNISNQISIIADPFAYNHIDEMRFVEYMGKYWKIISVEVLRPRLILTIGGVYNG